MTTSITGYPRIIIAKPSTPSACWPNSCPSEFFDSLVNPELNEEIVNCDNEPDHSLDNGFYPYLIEVSLINGLLESAQNAQVDVAKELSLTQVGAKIIRGPRLQNGFGGTDDGDGSVFGVALKTIVDFHNPISIQLDSSDERIGKLEVGSVGNFGCGERLINTSDLAEYPGFPNFLLGRPGWQINSETIFGVRHIIRPSSLNISDALNSLVNLSPLSEAIKALASENEDKLEFFFQLIYRYMPKKSSAYQFEDARSLSELEDLLNGGDMDWAGDNYGYNPDYDY